jgi:hypothetical protein
MWEVGNKQGQSSCYAARSDGVALARALSTNLSSVLISTIRARLNCLWRDAGASCRDRSYRGFAREPSRGIQSVGRCRGVSQGRFVLAASHRCLSSHGQSLIPSPVAATARLPVSSPGLRPFLAKQETGRLPSSTAFRPCGCSARLRRSLILAMERPATVAGFRTKTGDTYHDHHRNLHQNRDRLPR